MSSMNLQIKAIVICSTWDLGSGTLPTRMSRAVSIRRLVSVSSMGSSLCSELVQGDIVLDVVRDDGAVPRWHGAEVPGGKRRIGGQIGELAALDDVAHL